MLPSLNILDREPPLSADGSLSEVADNEAVPVHDGDGARLEIPANFQNNVFEAQPLMRLSGGIFSSHSMPVSSHASAPA